MQFSELLAVTLTFLIVLTTTHFENAHFVVLAMRHHGGFDSRAGHQGRADLQFCAVADCKNLINHDFLANVRSNLFYFNFFASDNTILFATGFYDRVHKRPLEWKFPWAHPKEPAIVARSCICSQSQDCATFAAHGQTYNSSLMRGFSHPTPPAPATGAHSRIFKLSAPENSTTAVLALVAQDMSEVDRVIAQRLDSGVPLVGEVARYIISAGGKRLRPVLLLLTCGALGYSQAQRHNLAAVVEFIHTATLLHDDVVDESTLRRGRPTANESFGNPASVLVGDFLYSRAFQMMVDAGSMRVMQVLSDATNVIAEGEVLQLMNMHDASLDEEGYLRVIRSKTAKLFEASARLGAILAGSTPDIEAACADYGQALGTAFQVIDDVLDYDGNATEMGKNLGDDLREGKATLPLILAMQRGNEAQRQMVKEAIENGSVDRLAEIVAIVRETGALDGTREAAASEAQRAIDAAIQLPDNPYRAAMVTLASQLLNRRT